MKKLILAILMAQFIRAGFAQQTMQQELPWKGQWITTIGCQSTSNTWVAFRKTVDVKALPEKAITRIAVDSKYWLWINGQSVVFEGGLKRGPNPLDTYYDEVDIAPYLKTGKNTVALLLCYFGQDGFSHKSSGRAGLLFDCQVPGFELLSDASWRCQRLFAYQRADNPLPNFRLPESNLLYDARLEPGNWQSEDYDDRGWWYGQAVVIGKAGDQPWNNLIRRPIPLFKDYGLKAYLNQQTTASGNAGCDTIICNLPYNAHITPYLKVEASEGQKIVMFTDNYLMPGDKTIRAEYITKKGIQEYESLGWMNGHKVYYIIPKGLTVLGLKYRESGYNAGFTGNFQCSDPYFSTLWKKACRTLYVDMRDSYMDCPERERAQWTGDAVIESGMSFYALSTSAHAMTRKWLHELLGWQKPNGSIFAPVPAGNWDEELPAQTLASVGYYGLWNYYLHTGDWQTIANLYDGIKRNLDLTRPDGKGTVKERRVTDGAFYDSRGEQDGLLMYNLWYYLAIKGMYNMALELGKTADAAAYAKFMADFKTSFNKQYWNGSNYRSAGYTGPIDDCTQALAVVSDVADADKYPALLKVFATEKHASPYMEKYVFEAMMKMGYATEALERNKERYAIMVNDKRYTTLYEEWDINGDYDISSNDHAWSGGSLTVLSQYVCGITPLKPGFELFRIQPQPGSLTQASATVESVKGIIRSSFLKTKNRLELNAAVPDGTSAIVGVPSEGVKSVKLNGKLVWKDGKYTDPKLACPANRTGEWIDFNVSEGNWKFEAEM